MAEALALYRLTRHYKLIAGILIILAQISTVEVAKL